MASGFQKPSMPRLAQVGLERTVVALILAGIAAVLSWSILRGLGVSHLWATLLSMTLAATSTLPFAERLPAELNGVFPKRRALSLLWLALGMGAIGLTARLATFMVDESRTENSIFPFDDFFVHHSCLSAHYQSARLQREGVANVYERTNFEGPEGEPKLLGSLVIDVFIYPPPFLLLSRLALAVSEDFTAWRAVWFGLEGTIVGSAILVLAFWIGNGAGRKALILSPLIWVSLPLLLTLQFGNFQLVAVAGSILAMLAFDRGRYAIGGALLAMLTWSKIFPGILILQMLFQRRWRSLAWTAGFGIVILVVAILVLGEAPFRAMLTYNLPRLSSGAALETQFAHPDAIACNHAIYGLVHKLALLGLPGFTQSTAVAVSWLYTIALIPIAWIAARTPDSRYSRALIWLALLHLASLRSPFTPDTYAQFPLVWLFVLLLAGVEGTRRRLIALIGMVLLANVMVPTVQLMPVSALLTITFAYQLVFFAFCLGLLLLLWRRERGSPPRALAVTNSGTQ